MKIPKYFNWTSSGRMVIFNFFEDRVGSAIMDVVDNMYCWQVRDVELYDGIIVSEEWHEWFAQRFPSLICKISDLDPGVRKKYSQVIFGDKFGVFAE